MIALFYILFVLNETQNKQDEFIEAKTDEKSVPSSCNHRSLLQKVKEFLIGLFDPKFLTECTDVCIRKRENNKRMILIVIFITGIIIYGSNGTEIYNKTKYTRIKFNWDATDDNLYSSYSCLTSLIGNFLLTSIFGKILKFSDPTLAIIGTVLTCVSQYVQVLLLFYVLHS